MGTATFLQVSDIHTKENLQEIKSVAELANSIENLDAVLCAGDLFDGWYHAELVQNAQEEQKKAQEKLSDEEQAFLQDESKQMMLQVHDLVQKHGEDVFSQLNVEDEQKEVLKQEYETNKETLAKVSSKFQKVNEALQTLEEKITKHISGADKVIGEINSTFYMVRGNHDIDSVYSMKNVHFLDKTSSIDIKGIKIAGAPNTNERIPQLADGFYKALEIDIFDKDAFVKEKGEEVYQKLLEDLPIAKRLKNAEIDILVTHKGLHEMAIGTGRNGEPVNYGYGRALEKIVKKKKPSVILGGHIHGRGYIVQKRGYQGIRSSDQRAYTLHVDTETKKVSKIDVYIKNMQENMQN